MKKFVKPCLCTIFGAVAIAATSLPALAAVQVIDFEQEAITNVWQPVGHYGGLDWLNWGIGFTDLPGTGFETLGSLRVAYNALGSEAQFGHADGFLLHGFDIAGGWNNGMTVTVSGYLGSDLVGTRSFLVSTDKAEHVQFDWSLVDRVTLNSVGGMPAPNLGGGGTHVGLDNVAVSLVPEPGTYAMVLMGLGCLVVAGRRRRG